jgi:hypothetical protein
VLTLTVGQVVKVGYIDQFLYTFVVEVTAIAASDEFKGRVTAIFAAEGGEITGGDILRWKGKHKAFKKTDILC